MNRKLNIILSACMLIGVLAGCDSTPTPSPSASGSPSASTGDFITIDGEKFTREDMGDALTEAEKQVASNYVNEYLQDKFFDGLEVTDAEVDAIVNNVKGQFTESEWADYLTYYGYTDETSMRESVRQNLLVQKKVDTYKAGYEPTEEDISADYSTRPDYYNHAVLDAVILTSAEDMTKAHELMGGGSTLEELATEFGTTVSSGERVSVNYAYFTSPLIEAKAGDILYTDPTDEVYIVSRVAEMKNTLEQVKSDVRESLISEKAEADYSSALDEFYKNSNVTILGEKIEYTGAGETAAPQE